MSCFGCTFKQASEAFLGILGTHCPSKANLQVLAGSGVPQRLRLSSSSGSFVGYSSVCGCCAGRAECADWATCLPA